jgi:hypothetical protein
LKKPKNSKIGNFSILPGRGGWGESRKRRKSTEFELCGGILCLLFLLILLLLFHLDPLAAAKGNAKNCLLNKNVNNNN